MLAKREKQEKLAGLSQVAATYHLMKNLNEDHGPVTVRQLMEAMSVARPTVIDHVKKLREAGLCRAVYRFHHGDGFIETKTMKEAHKKSKEVSGGRIAPMLLIAL